MEVQKRTNLLKNEKVPKALTIMVIPSIMASIINQLNIVMDTYFLGNFAKYPTASQTATATSMTILLLMTALSVMLAIGTAITTSQLLGRNKKAKVEQYMANSFVYTWILYTVLLIILLPLLPSFVSLLTGGSSGDLVYDNSLIYSQILLVGFPTVILAQLSAQTIRAEGQATLIVKMSIIQIIINAIINYILISDTFPAISFFGTNYEAAGAAIATIISQAFMAFMLMRVLFNREKTNYYINLKNLHFEKKWLQVFKNGLPQFVANTFFAIGTFLISLSIALLSIREGYSIEESVNLQAASGITVRIIMMVFLLVNGGIQGIQGFVAYQYGANNKIRLKESMTIIRKSAFVTGIIFFFIVFLGAERIAQIFTSNQEVIDYVALSLRFFGLTVLFFPSAHALFGLAAALGKPKIAIIFTVIRDGILFSSCAIVLPLIFSEIGVMITMPTSLLIGSIFIIIFGHKITNLA